MARTIDDLGLDISNRYAEDQKTYDKTLIKEARDIPSQTRVDTTTPSYASEFDALFELDKRGAVWAKFTPPPGYHTSRRRLFAEQTIPSLGSLDKQDAQLEKVESYGEQQKEAVGPSRAEEVDKETKILLTLLEKIHSCDEELVDTNSKRSQYHRG